MFTLFQNEQPNEAQDDKVMSKKQHIRQTMKHAKQKKTGWWFEPLWKIWKSIGMMTFPIYGKIKLMFQTTNQKMIYFGQWSPVTWSGTVDSPILRFDPPVPGAKLSRWCFLVPIPSRMAGESHMGFFIGMCCQNRHGHKWWYGGWKKSWFAYRKKHSKIGVLFTDLVVHPMNRKWVSSPARYKWTLPPLIPFITRVITHLRFLGWTTKYVMNFVYCNVVPQVVSSVGSLTNFDLLENRRNRMGLKIDGGPRISQLQVVLCKPILDIYLV